MKPRSNTSCWRQSNNSRTDITLTLHGINLKKVCQQVKTVTTNWDNGAVILRGVLTDNKLRHLLHSIKQTKEFTVNLTKERQMREMLLQMRFVAFPATEYDEVFLGYQTSMLRTRTEMVFKTLVFSLLNHLTWLIA
jgi:hypothetical protein